MENLTSTPFSKRDSGSALSSQYCRSPSEDAPLVVVATAFSLDWTWPLTADLDLGAVGAGSCATVGFALALLLLDAAAFLAPADALLVFLLTGLDGADDAVGVAAATAEVRWRVERRGGTSASVDLRLGGIFTEEMNPGMGEYSGNKSRGLLIRPSVSLRNTVNRGYKGERAWKLLELCARDQLARSRARSAGGRREVLKLVLRARCGYTHPYEKHQRKAKHRFLAYLQFCEHVTLLR